MTNKHKEKHPPMDVFEDEALIKVAEKMIMEARRLIKSDARDIRNLVNFCKFFFEYLPHVTLTRIESTVHKLQAGQGVTNESDS